MSEVEGTGQATATATVSRVRDDGEPDIYLPSRRCARCCTATACACASCATTRAVPRARDPRDLERRKAPIIGRLLHESGIWLVAPEDKRYGQDIMIPEERHRQRDRRGQVVASS